MRCATCWPAWPRRARILSSARTAFSARVRLPTRFGMPRGFFSSTSKRRRRKGFPSTSWRRPKSARARAALDGFRFHEACQSIYQFFWGDFCDWYIEWVKPQLTSADCGVAVAAWRNIFAALDAALRLLHPVMPFLTEELWHRLPQPEGARSIALDQFPEPRPRWIDAAYEDEMAVLQEIVVAA